MRIAVVCFVLLLKACTADSLALSPQPDVAFLCKSAEKVAFMPTKAPQLPADPVLKTIVSTSDHAALESAVAGVDIDAPRGTTSITPLSMASGSGNLAAVKLLLKRGANVNAVSDKGATAFEYAVLAGQFGMACHLLQAGATIPDSKQKAYLLPAAAVTEDFEGATIFVDWLLRKGYAIDATTSGDTALHAAAELGNHKLVELLLSRGANPCLKNAGGKTAAEVTAIEHSRTKERLTRACLQRGAKLAREMGAAQTHSDAPNDGAVRK
jgi:ankyrin repeat protein